MPTPEIKRDQQFILDRVLITDVGCWIWQQSITYAGYGQTSGLGECLAHRLSFRIFKGDIPQFILVCHTCDNKPCVNPEHLFLGTENDNFVDAVRKGRIDPIAASAHANSFHTTSSEIVEAVLKSYQEGECRIAIAEQHKISRTTVNIIIRKHKQNGST